MKRDTIDSGLLRLLACVPFILLSIVLIAFQAGEEDSKTLRPTQTPSVVVKGTTYVITSVFEGASECPEGFAYAGEIAVSGSDTLKPYYINPERPEWVYVYQECRGHMGYVRYVEEVLRWVTLLRYQGEVYIFLNDTYYLPYQTEVAPSDQARYDAVPYDSVLQELPEGFQPVGKTVFDGRDLVPTSELGCNRLPGQQVLADPKEPDILLLRNYSSGLEGPEYWVFVRFQDEKADAANSGAESEIILLSDLISSDVSSVKVNGQGETVELNESELAEFFEIVKGIEYRIASEEEKDLMAAPGAATVTITVQYSDGESEQFTLPYCLHEDTMYIAPAQSIVPFSRYLTGDREGGPITVTLNGQETPITLTEDEHVWLTVDPATVTATGAIVVLHKEGIPEIGYGHRYHIAQKGRQNSRRWTEVPWIDGFSGDWFLPLIVMGFTPDGIPNLEHKESNLPVSWEDIYGPLEPGKYLFVKEVVDPDDRSTGRYIGVEFTVN